MAARFWVGGTGTWDASDTTHWASLSGGAGGQSVPGASDDVTIDNHASGLNGGTITVNTNPTIISLVMTTMTGTLDFATNNNSITVTGSSGVVCSGTSTRTLSMGNGTWTLSNNSAFWNFSTVTNLTLNQNGSTIAFTGTGGTGSRRFSGGGKTYNVVSVASGSSSFVITGANTIATLTISAGNRVLFTSGTTTTVTTLTGISGSSSSNTLLQSDNPTNGAATISSANNWTGDWCGIAGMTFSGGGTFAATNSLSLVGNTGITITPPSAGGGLLRHPGMSGGMAA